MKIQRQLQPFKKLSVCGAPAEQFVQEFLRLMDQVLPSQYKVFCWTPGHNQLLNAVESEKMPSQYVEYVISNVICNPKRHSLLPSPDEVMAQSMLTFATNALSTKKFVNSEIYSDFFRPRNVRYSFGLHIGGDPDATGFLALDRGASEGEFPSTAQNFAMAVAPYLKFGLKGVPFPSAQNEIYRSAILILNERGVVELITTDAQMLLSLAFAPRPGLNFKPGILSSEYDRMIDHIKNGFSSTSANLPEFKVKNCWGQFEFKGFKLNPWPAQDGHAVPAIGIEIKQKVCSALYYARCLESLNLSVMQFGICVRALAGFSYAEIADQLNVEKATVITHVKRIFERYKIDGEVGLVAWLKERLAEFQGPL